MYLCEAGLCGMHQIFLPVNAAPGPIWWYGRSGNRGNQSQVHARMTRRGRRARDENLEDTPVRPPSLFVKQSPVPARRPMRRVPFTNLLLLDDQAEQGLRGSSNRGNQMKDKAAAGKKAFDKAESTSGAAKVAEEEEEEKEEDSGDRGTKWASLFERNSPSSGSGNNKTAWYDSLFAQKAGKKPTPASSFKGTPPSSSKLTSQQEKSIEQLQTLVKTLGVSGDASSTTPSEDAAITRSSSSSRRSNSRSQPKPGTGSESEPLSFSSILKKLQDVSNSVQGEDEGVYETEAETRDEDEVEEDGFESRELSELKVGTLRQMAKAKGLAGYSKMKKDELVQLLASCSD